MQRVKAVIFDIDGTLSSVNSWTSLTQDLGADVQQHLALYKEYSEGKLSYEKAKDSLVKLWQATGKANKKNFRDIFSKRSLKDGAYSLIHYLKAKYIICIITGSVDLYAEIVAQRLGIKHYFANAQLVWDKQDKLSDLVYRLDQDKMKLEQFLVFCAYHQLQPTDCVAVGDGDSDLELFRVTNHGVAIASESSHKLATLAWKQVNNLNEIKALL